MLGVSLPFHRRRRGGGGPSSPDRLPPGVARDLSVEEVWDPPSDFSAAAGVASEATVSTSLCSHQTPIPPTVKIEKRRA